MELTTPIPEDAIAALQVGDTIEISGWILCGRDAVLPKVVAMVRDGTAGRLGVDLRGQVIFHTAVSPAGVGPTSSNKLEIESSIEPLSAAGIKIHLGKGALHPETVAVPMISGRGLGITGGTLDKLASIPGFRTDLSEKRFIEIIQACGFSMMGQTGDVAPADKKLYALRDVTATVPSIPLITASIMCKKLAEGIDSLVLDVKWGTGAFMKTVAAARELAESMVRVGEAMGKNITAFITSMNQPLGQAVGNSLEIIESMECLQGQHLDGDLMQVTLRLTAEMLLLAGKASSEAEANDILLGLLRSGAAFECFKKMTALQGGDPSALDDFSKLPTASIVQDYVAPASGVLARVDADGIGRASLVLGGGRQKTDDGIDFAVGLSNLAKVGQPVSKGDRLATIHANDQGKLDQALAYVRDAFVIADSPAPADPLVVERIGR